MLLKLGGFVAPYEIYQMVHILMMLWQHARFQSLPLFKSFCLRDRGRLGDEGQPIMLKIGTQSRYVDLCNMSKF